MLSRILFSVSGISFFFLVVLSSLRYIPNNLEFKSYVENNNPTISANVQENQLPTGVAIPNISVWLPVYPALVNNSAWETTYKGVSYVTGSAIPGNKGNAIFYGHNWPNILGNLSSIQVGDTIEIVFANNTKKNFAVTTIQVVSPDVVSILDQTDDNRITIYTCIGFLDSNRLVVTAVAQD